MIAWLPGATEPMAGEQVNGPMIRRELEPCPDMPSGLQHTQTRCKQTIIECRTVHCFNPLHVLQHNTTQHSSDAKTHTQHNTLVMRRLNGNILLKKRHGGMPSGLQHTDMLGHTVQANNSTVSCGALRVHYLCIALTDVYSNTTQHNTTQHNTTPW